MDTFPSLIFPPQKLRWRIGGSPISGGQPISGPASTGDLSGGGWWIAEMTNVQLTKLPQVLAWRALAGRLRNGAVAMTLQCLDYGAPYPTGVSLDQPPAPPSAPFVPHADGSPFDDGSLYRSGSISSALVFNAALRSTTIVIGFYYGGPLRGGELFSITGALYGKRMHLVTRVTDDGSGLFTVDIIPPLREDHLSGDVIEFEDLGCVMKLSQSAIDSVWPTMEPPFKASPSVVFEESFS